MRKGLIVRDGNLNARERYGRLGVHIASDSLIGGRIDILHLWRLLL